MSEKYSKQRAAVAAAAREMDLLGLVSGSSGNVSLRLEPDGLMAITPMGVPYTELEESDVVVVDAELESVEGDLAPSSESLLHLGIYGRRPDAGAVIHTHSVFSSVAAVTGRPIPPIVDEMVVYVGGEIRVGEYAFPGTEELAKRVCDALDGRSAALIRNHGAVGVGRTLKEALRVCTLIERVAKIHAYALMTGDVGELPADVVEREQAIYKMRVGRP